VVGEKKMKPGLLKKDKGNWGEVGERMVSRDQERGALSGKLFQNYRDYKGRNWEEGYKEGASPTSQGVNSKRAGSNIGIKLITKGGLIIGKSPNP